jgi:hypothetical protein
MGINRTNILGREYETTNAIAKLGGHHGGAGGLNRALGPGVAPPEARGCRPSADFGIRPRPEWVYRVNGPG